MGGFYGGTASKALADSVLPFLGGVKSFPTTAFIPLEGQIKVHTGFSGPATKEYDNEVDFYTSTIESFLNPLRMLLTSRREVVFNVNNNFFVSV